MRTLPLKRFREQTFNFFITLLDGHRISRRDFHNKYHLLILFLHRGNCSDCDRLVRELEAYQSQIADWGGKFLLILRQRRDFYSLPSCLVGLDEEGVVGQQLLKDLWQEEALALVVLNRYGSLIEAFVFDHSEPPPWEEAVKSLMLADIACPECGAPLEEFTSF